MSFYNSYSVNVKIGLFLRGNSPKRVTEVL